MVLMTAPTPITKWLDQKFLDWQQEQGGSRTLIEFADWLGIKQPTLSHYMTGRRTPNGKAAMILGAKLGWEIFDLLGWQRPDPVLQRIAQIWDNITDEQQKELAEMAQRMAEENEGR